MLGLMRGIGPWTTGMFCGYTLGDPDTLPLGDVHIPNQISKILTGIPFADDDTLVELLSPYAGQRFRVLTLLGMSPPSLKVR